jgi:hypothetical protein
MKYIKDVNNKIINKMIKNDLYKYFNEYKLLLLNNN